MISSSARWTALAAGFCLIACQSPGAPKEAQDAAAADPLAPQPYDPRLLQQGPLDPVGVFLADLDKSMRAWTNLVLTAQTRSDRGKAGVLQDNLQERVRKRLPEILDALQSGAPRNRAIAAGALGFSHLPEVLGPLVVALADEDSGVVQNAALSLALLQDPNTPLPPVLEVLQSSRNPKARANAAYAIRSLLEAGLPPNEDVLKAARRALVDEEPFARAQGALILAVAGDGDSIPDLAELLGDREALVASAATQALYALGHEHNKLIGPCARALVVGLGTAPEEHRPAILRALVLLSGQNYEDDVKAWSEWAQRLP